MTVPHQPRPPRMSADEFLDWSAAEPAERCELIDGQVVLMAPERLVHARVKLATAIALRRSLGESGLDCEAMTDGPGVRVGESSMFIPDALVRCGPRLPDDAREVEDPVIVVEVTSPSTQRHDLFKKLRGYLSLPSVRHYLILEPEDQLVIHHRRGDDGQIETRLLSSRAVEGSDRSVVALDPPGVTVVISHLFSVP